MAYSIGGKFCANLADEHTSLQSYCLAFIFENCITLVVELCPLVYWQVSVVWVVAYQHSDVGHCFFRFIAGAEDRVHQFPMVDSGCFNHCVLFIRLSLLNVCVGLRMINFLPFA
jgi:hypothetical protein